LLLQHVPARGEHRVRYYSWYSNPSPGNCKGSGPCGTPIETDATGRLGCDPDAPDSKYIKAAHTTFAPLIKKVYEVDPLICPHCGNQMRHLAVIEDTAVDHVDSLSPRGVGPVPATYGHRRLGKSGLSTARSP
jgi:hypothetical protein